MILQTASGLTGLPSSFAAAVFSVWLDIPDGGTTGVVFGDQITTPLPGFQVTIQNDGTGTPQITIEAWDAGSAPIVVATYDFAGWAGWVNVLVSLNTATQQIQVWANTIVSAILVETQLAPVSVVWSSTNPIGVLPGQSWVLETVP